MEQYEQDEFFNKKPDKELDYSSSGYFAAPLRPRWELFCQKYVELKGEAGKAYKEAGFKGSQGSQLLKRPEIRKRIKEIQEQLAEQTLVPKERVCKELEKIIFGKEVKNSDKISAASTLSKMVGWDAPIQTNHILQLNFSPVYTNTQLTEAKVTEIKEAEPKELPQSITLSNTASNTASITPCLNLSFEVVESVQSNSKSNLVNGDLQEQKEGNIT